MRLHRPLSVICRLSLPTVDRPGFFPSVRPCEPPHPKNRLPSCVLRAAILLLILPLHCFRSFCCRALEKRPTFSNQLACKRQSADMGILPSVGSAPQGSHQLRSGVARSAPAHHQSSFSFLSLLLVYQGSQAGCFAFARGYHLAIPGAGPLPSSRNSDQQRQRYLTYL